MVLPSLSTPIKPINIQSSYGGPGGSRTRVQNAFTLKGLQLFFYQRFFLVARRAARSIGVLFFCAMLFSVFSKITVVEYLLPASLFDLVLHQMLLIDSLAEL